MLIADQFAAEQAGLWLMAARPVQLGPGAVRVLWAYMLRWATAERLLLLDAVAALGPGLLVLWAHSTPGAVSTRMKALKGSNDPARRCEGPLRGVAGALNRVLTMLHTADDPADAVRELAVLCSWRERAQLVCEAAARLRGGRPVALEDTVRAVDRELPAFGLPQGTAYPYRWCMSCSRGRSMRGGGRWPRRRRAGRCCGPYRGLRRGRSRRRGVMAMTTALTPPACAGGSRALPGGEAVLWPWWSLQAADTVRLLLEEGDMAAAEAGHPLIDACEELAADVLAPGRLVMLCDSGTAVLETAYDPVCD